jgi:hypothetical protein
LNFVRSLSENPEGGGNGEELCEKKSGEYIFFACPDFFGEANISTLIELHWRRSVQL